MPTYGVHFKESKANGLPANTWSFPFVSPKKERLIADWQIGCSLRHMRSFGLSRNSPPYQILGTPSWETKRK